MKKSLIYVLVLFIIPISALGTHQNDRDTLIVLDHPKSLEKLLNQFKGQVVYIDLLASWCKPCIAELEHAKKLNNYFLDNKIVKLYITIDEPEDIEKCVSLLIDHKVTGYLATYRSKSGDFNAFSTDLSDIFFKENVAIPRYAIVDNHGKLVVGDAFRPSSPDLLKQQLDAFL